MRWNGRNYRPQRPFTSKSGSQPQRRGPLDTSKMKWVGSYFSGGVNSSDTPIQQEYIWLGLGAHGTGETWRSEDNLVSYTILNNVPSGAWAYTDYSDETGQIVVGRNYNTSYNTKGFQISTDKGLTYVNSVDTLSYTERPRVGDYSPELGAWMWKTYYQNQIASSTDGINWTETFVSSSNQTEWFQWLPEYSLFIQLKRSSNAYYSEDLVSEILCSETRDGGQYKTFYPGGVFKNSAGEYIRTSHDRDDRFTTYRTTNGKDWTYDGNIISGVNTTLRPEPRCALVNGDTYLMNMPGNSSYDGMYSTDDGLTWSPYTPVDNTSLGFNMRRAIKDPNSDIIYGACRNNGIIKSLDGGFTWQDHFNITGGVRSIIAIPK